MKDLIKITTFSLLFLFISSCKISGRSNEKSTNVSISKLEVKNDVKFLDKPLISEIFTADPSAHIFNDRIYVYASHDIENGISDDDSGNQYDMIDYHVLSMDSIRGEVTIHDVGLAIKDIPWARSKLWAPDAAFKNDTYFLYFPVKDKNKIFKIGVATSDKPEGPFKPEPVPIKGSYSIDPSVFTDDDGTSYMYFGGNILYRNKGVNKEYNIDAYKIVQENGELSLQSGKQELFENIINQ